MKKILVLNSGSTSLKFKVFVGGVEKKQGKIEGVTNHRDAIKQALKEISDLRDIDAVGHRVVHGGGKFFTPTKVTDENFAVMDSFSYLAPLHNPYSLICINEVKEYLPTLAQYAVFDTAFFHDLPEISQTYPLPTQISVDYGIRRFGFHGISHNFLLNEAAIELGKSKNDINLITCHLGGGSSVAAIKHGRPIDTSMGFTPLEGLAMMTRTGDIDAGLVLELLKILPGEINAEKVQMLSDILNKKSGIFGLTNGINDYRNLLREYALGNGQAALALDIFIYRLVKYIGGYYAALDGNVDAIVFSGAIGSGDRLTRDLVMKKLQYMNVKELTIKTDEEMMIAREVEKMIT